MLDRFLIMMQQQEIPCIVCFNKSDIDEEEAGRGYLDIYGACGYRTLMVSARQNLGIEQLKELLSGKTTTVADPAAWENLH